MTIVTLTDAVDDAIDRIEAIIDAGIPRVNVVGRYASFTEALSFPYANIFLGAISAPVKTSADMFRYTIPVQVHLFQSPLVSGMTGENERELMRNMTRMLTLFNSNPSLTVDKHTVAPFHMNPDQTQIQTQGMARTEIDQQREYLFARFTITLVFEVPI